jgi:hypothetical protein
MPEPASIAKWRLYLGRVCYFASLYAIGGADPRALGWSTAWFVAAASLAVLAVWVWANASNPLQRLRIAAGWWFLFTAGTWSHLLFPQSWIDRLTAWQATSALYVLAIFCVLLLVFSVGLMIWARFALFFPALFADLSNGRGSAVISPRSVLRSNENGNARHG